MADRLGVLEISCDAPPYPIVRACREIGINDPEDVRWCRLGRFHRRPIGWRELLRRGDWQALLCFRPPRRNLCSCGRAVPLLNTYRFALSTGEEVDYALAQCCHCRTVFWE
jgi:hypothetical protein